MNEPIFTLEEAREGARRTFADPLKAPPGMTPATLPSRRPLRTRPLAGVFEAGAAASRRLFPLRS